MIAKDFTMLNADSRTCDYQDAQNSRGPCRIPRGSQLTYLRLKSHQTYQGQAFEEKALGLLLMAGAKN